MRLNSITPGRIFLTHRVSEYLELPVLLYGVKQAVFCYVALEKCVALRSSFSPDPFEHFTRPSWASHPIRSHPRLAFKLTTRPVRPLCPTRLSCSPDPFFSNRIHTVPQNPSCSLHPQKITFSCKVEQKIEKMSTVGSQELCKLDFYPKTNLKKCKIKNLFGKEKGIFSIIFGHFLKISLISWQVRTHFDHEFQI